MSKLSDRSNAAAHDGKHLLQTGSFRILVIEDNQDAAESLLMLFELDGHDVRVAYDGKEGMEIASAFMPDIAFIDIGLPGQDGREVGRRMRGIPGLARMTLVALSGYGRIEDQRESRDAGFDHHLVKPIDFRVVGEVLDHLAAMRLKEKSSGFLH